jgi:hypothetical protein
MTTLRANVIIPEVFTPYIDELTTLRNPFLSSGVMTQLPDLNAEEGGDYITVPAWAADLAGDAERLTDSTSLTSAGITATAQNAVILHNGRLWTARDLASLAAGSDAMAAIGRKVSSWLGAQQERDLIATLNGCFGPLTTNTTGSFRTLTIDSVSGTPTALGPRQVAAGRALLGDQGDKLMACAIPGAVYYDLYERKALDFVLESDSAAAIAANPTTDFVGGSFRGTFEPVRVPFFMDMRVIVTDNITATAGNYGVFFFTEGAVLTGQQAGLRTETDRDIAAKSSAMSVDWHPVYHLLGSSYAKTAGVNPSRAVLGTATSWTKVFQNKNIGCVRATVTSNFD